MKLSVRKTDHWVGLNKWRFCTESDR